MKLFPVKNSRALTAFTMIEVAICLAIIGVALVGIIGVLPRGMNTQRDNLQETIVSQDANVLMELIRNGSHGPDDLTNYVYAITNSWTSFNASGGTNQGGIIGYSFASVSGATPLSSPGAILLPINSGSNIVSVLSTPEYTDFEGAPIPTLIAGGISNHVVAYVRAMSGLAAEKAPQNNPTMQEDAFAYRVLCVNAPMAMDLPPLYDNTATYNLGDRAYLPGIYPELNYKFSQWVAVSPVGFSGIAPPGTGTNNWARNYFADQLMNSQRELRLKFMWPLLPNANVGNNFQNFRATIGGQLTTNLLNGVLFYFYQPQSFTTTQ